MQEWGVGVKQGKIVDVMDSLTPTLASLCPPLPNYSCVVEPHYPLLLRRFTPHYTLLLHRFTPPPPLPHPLLLHQFTPPPPKKKYPLPLQHSNAPSKKSFDAN